MKKIILTILFVAFPLTAHAWVAKVMGVIDGDTIRVFNAGRGTEKIRLYGIDAPEKGQPFGTAAKQYLASVVAGSVVEIETTREDSYGNRVAVVRQEEKIINQEMVRGGFAWVYRKYCDRPFCEYWLTLENEAKQKKIGLWQAPDPIPPRSWRLLNRE